ncbi:F-box/kelch-repeat protein At5g39560-like [Brassica napus]|nr:PREDICTED: F-box/kelch-repeat protein At5g39560-like [Brassica oleracea var. oleracea]XP_013704721.1 F-box/kelch-repeat protein At5g39560-like [Brassica napus]
MNRDDEQPQGNKNTSPPPQLNLQSHSFSSLPDEIADNILARVSRCNYPSLSLVSKRFHSLLSSPELYKTRSHIRTTEPCLYVCLKHDEDQPSKWFTLWMRPVDETLTKDDDHLLPHDDYSLFTVPSSCNPFLEPYCTSVAVGLELYVIGGTYEAPSSAVRILDCRTHTWRDGPSMLVARWCVDAFLLYEKIYVMGRSGINESLAWIEVLDIKTQTWRHLRSLGAYEFDSGWFEINVFEGKIYAIAENKSYAYDPQESRWEVVETHRRGFKFIKDWCVIEDVMYCFTHSGYCKWYDSKTRDWIDVKGSGMELLRMHRTCGLAWRPMLRIRNLGGKLLVMWVPDFERDNEKTERRIWCAKIALEKRGNDVWGKIEWANSVHEWCWFTSCVVSI